MVIDGEIVCLDEAGRPDFGRLRHRLGVGNPAEAARLAEEYPVTLQAFDLVYREGQVVAGWALRRRKEMLRSLVRPSASIVVPDYVARDGVAFFEAAREHDLEGIVAKEADSHYLPGQRSPAWLAIRRRQKRPFVIGGFTYGGRWNPRSSRPPREPLTSLLIGLRRNDGQLSYVGEVTGGFQEEMSDLIERLDASAAAECPFVEAPETGRLAFWCRPELVAAINYAEWGPDGRLRFPVYQTLRPDVPVEACRAEEERP
jgi:bifunctional non-homologous end joining protein LigD